MQSNNNYLLNNAARPLYVLHVFTVQSNGGLASTSCYVDFDNCFQILYLGKICHSLSYFSKKTKNKNKTKNKTKTNKKIKPDQNGFLAKFLARNPKETKFLDFF